MSGGRVSAYRTWRRIWRVASSPDPAAGAEPSLTVPAGSIWRVAAVRATLAADATVANRAARLRISADGVVVADIPPADVQTASQTVVYSWSRSGATWVTGTGQAIALPELVLLPGAVIATLTDAIVAGDNWSALDAYVFETVVKHGPVNLDELPELVVAMLAPPGE